MKPIRYLALLAGLLMVCAVTGSGLLLIAYVAMSLGDAIGFNGMLFNGG